MHADRLCFWTIAYENEKKMLLQQYNDEIDSYKEQKFRAHKELECVHYGLEALADERQKLATAKHEEKVYEIKSKVSWTKTENLQNHHIVSEIIAIGFGPFGETIGNRLCHVAFIIATPIAVHVFDHSKTLLNRIDVKLLQLNITNAARQNVQHFEFVRLIVIVICLKIKQKQ